MSSGFSQISITDDLLKLLKEYYQSYKSAPNIWRDECLFCYNSPKNSTDEYFICTKTYLGFCSHHLQLYLSERKKFFIGITRVRIISPQHEQKMPTKLGIGVEGGFEAQKFHETYRLIMADSLTGIHHIVCPVENLPKEVADLLVTNLLSVDRSNPQLSWSESDAPESKFSKTLIQIPNPPTVPSTGWKCQICGMDNNLWLNLSDGSILCGRSNYDGTGGNNHSLTHYCTTKYPLAVKLNTLDACSVEVYSYEEDMIVNDSLIDMHLAHFGIDRHKLKKTEKTIVEKEIELNMSLKGDMDAILERGVKLQPLFGPGYTGIKNIGNTCYIASVIQVLFSLSDIVCLFTPTDFPRYFLTKSFIDLVHDTYFQLCKVALGLYSGQYSEPVFSEDGAACHGDSGICPMMLKLAITGNHPEFRTFRQHDAAEFFTYLCDHLSTSKAPPDCPISIEKLFTFDINEYYQLDESKSDIQQKVITDKILRISLPSEAQDYSSEISGEAYQTGERKLVLWDDCFHQLCSPSFIDRMTINEKSGPAWCYTRLGSLPDYLVVQICRFSFDSKTYAQVKLDVSLTPPKILDLAPYIQTPDFSQSHKRPSKVLTPSEKFILEEVSNMGFPKHVIMRAIKETKSIGVNEALDWILSHPDASVEPSEADVNEESVATLLSMGFPREFAIKALRAKNWDCSAAVNYLLSNIDSLESEALAAVPVKSSQNTETIQSNMPKYQLLAFISHIGSSPHVGHYVCHIFKDDQWVLFNDENVAESVDPPLDRGYLYFYGRKDD